MKRQYCKNIGFTLDIFATKHQYIEMKRPKETSILSILIPNQDFIKISI